MLIGTRTKDVIVNDLSIVKVYRHDTSDENWWAILKDGFQLPIPAGNIKTSDWIYSQVTHDYINPDTIKRIAIKAGKDHHYVTAKLDMQNVSKKDKKVTLYRGDYPSCVDYMELVVRKFSVKNNE